MKNVLFVLIDALDKVFYYRYQDKLNSTHQALLKKLENVDVLVLGNQYSIISSVTFSDLKQLYRYIAKHATGRDIVIGDAYAGLLSLKDTELVLHYMREHRYDVCLTENLPEGLVPMAISHEFIDELSSYIEDDQVIVSTFKNIINWEYKGIDVGVYLSPSLLIMERIDFLPVHKGAVEYIYQLANCQDISLETMPKFIVDHPQLLRHYPQYIAIEISSESDNFYTSGISSEEMNIEMFRKIITEIDELAPEALISIGVWGDPFMHTKFPEIIEILKKISNPVLVECRSIFLSEAYVQLVLSRPHTELIFDVSFTMEQEFQAYKNTPYTLEQTRSFLKSQSKEIRIRLTRVKETEQNIKYFLKEWADYRVLITKADSFGTQDHKTVDLAPLKRHACYALRRELTILNNGDVLLCRQSKKVLGSLKTQSLLSLWKINRQHFQDQQQQRYYSCEGCQHCDDWWVWN
ncbi:MAG: SPASM domain-containing protein [Brevinema sp.]